MCTVAELLAGRSGEGMQENARNDSGFLNSQPGSDALPASCTTVTEVLFLVPKLTIHLYLVRGVNSKWSRTSTPPLRFHDIYRAQL